MYWEQIRRNLIAYQRFLIRHCRIGEIIYVTSLTLVQITRYMEKEVTWIERQYVVNANNGGTTMFCQRGRILTRKYLAERILEIVRRRRAVFRIYNYMRHTCK